MENDSFLRSKILLGDDVIERLSKTHIAVFGVGGVGGYVCEALARTGVGAFDLFDKDVIDVTNINRQIIADFNTLGEYKTDVMKRRILSINPNAIVNVHHVFFLPDNSHEYDFCKYDYIADAVDTISAKIELAVKAERGNVPIISSMGAGNKLNPTMFEVADIYETSVCPLARVMRRELKKRGVKSLLTVYSKEPPVIQTVEEPIGDNGKKRVVGSVAFVPSVAGMVMAGEIIKHFRLTYF